MILPVRRFITHRHFQRRVIVHFSIDTLHQLIDRQLYQLRL